MLCAISNSVPTGENTGLAKGTKNVFLRQNMIVYEKISNRVLLACCPGWCDWEWCADPSDLLKGRFHIREVGFVIHGDGALLYGFNLRKKLNIF